MKILLVNDTAIPLYGAPIVLIELRKGLRRRGHDARLFSSSARVVSGRDNMADYRCFGTLTRLNTLLQTANPWAFWRLRRVLRNFHPDVVHVKMFETQLSPLILPLLRRIPSLYHGATYRPICPMGGKMLPDGTPCHESYGTVCYQKECLPLRSLLPQMLEMYLCKRWFSSFDRIIAVSEKQKRHLAAEGIEVDEVLWNSVPNRPSRPPLSSPPTVAFAGRLDWGKGPDVLLHAFAKILKKIPDARLIIAGDGPEREHLKKMVSDCGLSSRVVMTGHLPRNEMERRFDPAWVQVVPGRWAEPFGNVAAEAMMRGTAVVASNLGGPGEFIQNGRTGFLVPPGDDNALAAALIRLLRKRELAEEMGKAGREFALVHFDFESYLDKILQLYQQICLNFEIE